MRNTFETLEECTYVEGYIWENAVVNNCGDFGGIRELTLEELFCLKGLIDMQVQAMIVERKL